MKVGDRVKIIPFSIYEIIAKYEIIKNFDFLYTMTEYCDREATIVEVNFSDFLNKFIYKLDIDKGMWNWQDYMFENYKLIKVIKDINYYCSNICIKSCNDSCLFKMYK